MEAFISQLPKAELHVHFEGTMTTDLLFKLAEKNNIDIGSRESIEKRRSEYQDFSEFIEMYAVNVSVIQTLDDIYEVAYDYMKACEKEKIYYSEICICPASYENKGMAFSDVFDVLLRASEDAENNLGVKACWMLTIVKHYPIEKSLRMVQESEPYLEKIRGIGMAGVEIGNPASLFSHIYDEARRIGYKNFTAHSGEFGDPRCIIDTLYHLKVSRIDHGVRCLEDEFLVKFLKESNIWLTVCPLSNYHLKVLDNFFDGKHIVGLLMEKGIKITINSDDPPLLGGFLNSNYMLVADLFKDQGEQRTKEILFGLAKNSFIASFMEEHEKAKYLELLQNFANAEGIPFD